MNNKPSPTKGLSVKLSKKQKEIFQRLQNGEKVYFANNQNKTAVKLILLGIAYWDERFENLVISEKGRSIKL